MTHILEAEKTVPEITDIARRLLFGIESKFKSKLALQAARIPLIIRHVAFVFPMHRLGLNGRTAYTRLVGSEWKSSVGEIGKQVLGKLAVKKPNTEKKHKHKNKRKLAARSIVGTLLGV